MNEDNNEGTAIANLIGTDGCSVIGWVYRWQTGALAVMWDVNGPQRVTSIQPDLCDAEKREIDFDSLKRIRRRGNWLGEPQRRRSGH